MTIMRSICRQRQKWMTSEFLDEARRLRQRGAVGEMDVVTQIVPLLFHCVRF
jgi:hypothetical protein